MFGAADLTNDFLAKDWRVMVGSRVQESKTWWKDDLRFLRVSQKTIFAKFYRYSSLSETLYTAFSLNGIARTRVRACARATK